MPKLWDLANAPSLQFGGVQLLIDSLEFVVTVRILLVAFKRGFGHIATSE